MKTVDAKLKPNFKYLFTAIWLMPTDNSFGGWPRSGEIDMVEIRGKFVPIHSKQIQLKMLQLSALMATKLNQLQNFLFIFRFKSQGIFSEIVNFVCIFWQQRFPMSKQANWQPADGFNPPLRHRSAAQRLEIDPLRGVRILK